MSESGHGRCLSLRPYCTWQIESRRPIGRAAVRPHWPAPPRDALGAPAARRPPRPPTHGSGGWVGGWVLVTPYESCHSTREVQPRCGANRHPIGRAAVRPTGQHLPATRSALPRLAGCQPGRRHVLRCCLTLRGSIVGRRHGDSVRPTRCCGSSS